MSSRKEYKIKNISQGRSLTDIFIVLLQEVNGSNMMPVTVSAEEMKILLQLIDIQKTTDHSYSILLEATESLVDNIGGIFENITINRIENGAYFAQLIININGDFHNSTLSAGIAICIALHKRIPIFIEDSLSAQCEVKVSNNSFVFPLQSMSTLMLKDALNDAITKEHYELASYLQEELNKRK